MDRLAHGLLRLVQHPPVIAIARGRLRPAHRVARGIDEVAEGDEDMSEYIHRLEEDRDITADADEADAESIAEEFERFLRSTDDGTPNA